jgi:hypothetical protein
MEISLPADIQKCTTAVYRGTPRTGVCPSQTAKSHGHNYAYPSGSGRQQRRKPVALED